MGGMWGEVRGMSKAEVYRKYAQQLRDDTTFETRIPDPEYKKSCKASMVQDPATGEWVLYYHLHS